MDGWKYYRSLISGYYVKLNNNYPDFSYTIIITFNSFYVNYGITYPLGVFSSSQEITKKKWYKAIRNLIIRSKI